MSVTKNEIKEPTTRQRRKLRGHFGFSKLPFQKAMWAAHMKAEGQTDEQIFAVCRKYAYQLGKSEARSDPKREFSYHEEMAEKADAYRASLMAPPAMQSEGI